MNSLQTALTEYLSMRRALGFKLYDVGLCLQHFVDFTEAEGACFITTELAVRWAIQPKQASPAHWARRLGMVRQFAQYCSALEARTEIPPQGLLPHRYTRKSPYLYSDEEITRLLQAARRLPSPGGLRALTYTTVFGLLAVTGMRISEPIALDRTDVDLIDGSLTIRGSKFGKSRWLPLHSTTRKALQNYAAQRDRLYSSALTSSFFISERGIRHYGLFANGGRADNLDRARELLNVAIEDPPVSAVEPADAARDSIYTCPACGGPMIVIEVFARGQLPRAPPTRISVWT